MQYFRGLIAVLAGLVTIVILSNGTDTVLELTGVFPSLEAQRNDGFNTPWMLVIALSYRLVFGFVGGRVTATLSPSRPSRHVAALVAIGGLLGLAGVIATLGISPAWFSISMFVLTPVAVWLGGRSTSAAGGVAHRQRRPASA